MSSKTQTVQIRHGLSKQNPQSLKGFTSQNAQPLRNIIKAIDIKLLKRCKKSNLQTPAASSYFGGKFQEIETVVPERHRQQIIIK